MGAGNRLAVMLSLGASIIVAAETAVAPPPEDPVAFFTVRIEPVLKEHCWRCHGPEKQRGGLRLDSREAVVRGGRTQVVHLGQPEHSKLIDAVNYEDADVQMPPAGILPAQQRADLARWVLLGLPWAPSGDPAPRQK